MKKLFISLLLVCFLVGSGNAMNPALMSIVAGGSSAVCAEFYAPALTVDQDLDIGVTAQGDFAGYVYVAQSDQCVCKVDVYVRNEAGDPTGINYYMRVFTIDGNDDVDTIVGTSSNAIAGANIQGEAGVWMSAIDDYFNFSPCLSLTNGEDYAFTIFPDDDADLTDNPEIDSVNYWGWGYDNENNLEAELQGRCWWTWDSEIPYVDGFGISVNDEGAIKIWTE